MRYRYSGYDGGGSRVKGVIEAASIDEAKAILRQRGIYFERLQPARSFEFGLFRREIPKSQLIDFSNYLAIYLRSGISLAQALSLLKNQFDRGKMAELIFWLQKQIEEGAGFDQALERQKIYRFPGFFLESVRVAQESGALDQVLSQIADYLKEQKRLEESLKRALVYPLFIILVSVGMIAFMLSFVVPKITKLFEQMDQELPTLTRAVVTVGEFMAANWPWLLAGAVAGAVAFRFVVQKSPALRLAIDSFFLKVPLLRDLIIASDLGRYSYLLSLLSRSGVTFVHAAKLAAETIKNSRLKRSLTEATTELVEGKSFFAALMRSGFDYDRSFLQAVALAEESGEVAEVLQNLAELYRERTKSRVELFLSLLEPALILLVGGIVGVVVVAMLLPIFRMNILSF